MRPHAVLHPRDSTDERGVVAIMVALTLTGLIVSAALVLDFGLTRLDRQANKLAVDSAVTAGMRGLDGGTGEVYSYRGVCEAIKYLKANRPDLAALGWGTNCDGSKDSVVCEPSNTGTHARFEQSVTLSDGTTYRVRIRVPYTESDMLEFSEESLPTLAGDRGEPSEMGCDQIGVDIRQGRRPGFGSLASPDDIVSSVRSAGRVTVGDQGEQAVALLLLERTDCDAIVINGTNSYIRVLANGDVPGLIHSDSDGTGCSGGNRILVGDHTDGIKAFKSPTEPGIIRVRAIGTVKEVHAFDDAAKVVAEDSAPSTGPLVTRKPVDNRYIVGVRNAMAEFKAQVSGGYTNVFSCAQATKVNLEAVPSTGSIWVDCTSGSQTFSTANVTIQATKVYFDAKQVTANNLAMPNASRVYVRGDSSTNGTAISVSNATLRMNHGGLTTCPNTSAVSSPNRGRLIIGSGSLTSNSGGTVQLCSTSVIMLGERTPPPVPTGCVPSTTGVAPWSPTCNGRLSLGGPTDWTAPNMVWGTAASSHHGDLEDLALWTEAPGSHDVGGGGFMRLSGVFMLPNGEFKIHGGSGQDVKNSQYIARKLRADGGSVLEMQPNPHDVVTIPILGGFELVR